MKIRLIIFGAVLVIVGILGIVFYNKRPDTLQNKDKEDERTISFFRNDYQMLLEGQVEENLDCKIVLEVEATGNYEYVKENLIQEVKFVKMIKGKNTLNLDNKTAYVIGCGWAEDNVENKEGKLIIGKISTGFINYMKKGDHYVLFAKKLMYDKEHDSNVVLLDTDLLTMKYLNISSNKSYIYKTKSDMTKYKNVRDSEFFSNDKKTLDKMIACKKKILKKLGIKKK